MNKKVLFSCFSAAFLLSGICLAENLTFTGTTDKNPLLYKAGEEVRFTVTLVDRDKNNAPVPGRRLKWVRRGDDGKTESGEALSDQPLVVRTSIGKPGFVRLTVNVLDGAGQIVKGAKHAFDGGAGADVAKIPAWPKPADFDAFWDAEVKRLLAQPYQVKLSPVEWRDKRTAVYKFEITTYPGERPATGLIGYPVNAKPKSLSLIVSTIGYGFGRYWVTNSRILEGNIWMTLARQGEDPIREPEYYEKLKKNEMKNFCFRHNNDKRKNDFYQMIIRNLRAVQYAKSRPEWNGKSLLVTGGSMGGFQAVALAALDPDVTRCQATIPWVADLAGESKFKRMGGWRPAFTETLGYFDTANLATRVKCPVSMEIGLGDYICPPSGQMILFRNLKGPKTMKVNQNFGHGAPYGVNTAAYEFKEEIR